MKKITYTILFCSVYLLSLGQWTTAGSPSERFGNSNSGILSNQWKAIGIGNFQGALTVPESRIHVNEFLLPAPLNLNYYGNLLRTDGSDLDTNEWELYTGNYESNQKI
jgi:hypothetical protein